jgi:ABC-type sugar transport system permease subunit
MFKNYMLTNLLVVFTLLTAIPVGLLIAWLTKEELRDGQKWFRLIVLLSCAGSVAFLMLKNEIVALSLVYSAIVSYMSVRRT